MRTPTAPTSANHPGAPQISHFMQASDPCFYYDDFACHDNPISYDDYDDPDLAAQENWDWWDCPYGCTTYPLGNKDRYAISEAFALVSGTGDCGTVKQLVQTLINTGHLRTYLIDYGDWGDYHPYFNDIHIWGGTFGASSSQLAHTLMHEGWHAWRSSLGDPDAGNDNYADAFAFTCVFG